MLLEQSIVAISAAKVAANRLNARKSTGPRTLRGKAVAARNSLKHGLFARSLLLPGEDPAELTQLKVDLIRRLNPRDPLELIFVERIISATWKLRRLERCEAQLFARECEAWDENPLNDREAQGLGRRKSIPAEVAWQSSTPEFKAQLDRLATQERHLESALRRNLRQLALLQKLEIDQPVTEYAMERAAAEQSSLENRQNEATAVEKLKCQASIDDVNQARKDREAERHREANKKLRNKAKRQQRRVRRQQQQRDEQDWQRHFHLPTVAMCEALEAQKRENEATAAEADTEKDVRIAG